MKLQTTKDWTFKASATSSLSETFKAGVTYKNVSKETALAAAAAGVTESPEALVLLKEAGGKKAVNDARKAADKRAKALQSARTAAQTQNSSVDSDVLAKFEALTEQRNQAIKELEDAEAVVERLVEAYNAASPEDADEAESLLDVVDALEAIVVRKNEAADDVSDDGDGKASADVTQTQTKPA